MNQWDMTDTDSSVGLESVWKVTPLHMLPIGVSPPSTRTNLRVLLPEEHQGMGGFNLSWPSGVRPIDAHLHELLLEQSIIEYGDLWRSLAGR